MPEPDILALIGEKPSAHVGRRVRKDSLLPEGIKGLAEAFAAAREETGEATPVDIEETMPVSEVESEAPVEQAEPSEDQPEVAESPDTEINDELQSLIDEIGEAPSDEDEGESTVDPIAEFVASDDFWQTEVEVDFGDGPERVTVQQLSEAGMRQADYTRKTQALAAQRKTVEQASEFYDAFNQNPQEFARLLAVRAGLIEEGDRPVRDDVAGTKIPTPEEIEAQIEQAVEERFTSDPRYAEMQAASARSQVAAEFDRIESDRGITLSETVRQQIVDTAVRSNTADLEVVLDAMLYKQQQQKARADEKRRGAPSRPTKSAAPVESELPPAGDVKDAFNRALAELSA